VRELSSEKDVKNLLKKNIFLWLICIIGLSVLPSAAGAEGGAVNVHVANFPVKVNGQLMNNERSQFPFIVYKDITYAPLNWDTLQELELSADWNEQDGLTIYKICCANSYWVYKSLEKQPYDQHLSAYQSSNRSYTAHVANYPIQIWGNQIKNDEELYPFLEFRDVTYMPLTWGMAHSRLKMDLQWSNEEGLAIWSGQDSVMQQIVYDDEEALYVRAGEALDPAHTMLKVYKSLRDSPVWLNAEQIKTIEDKIEKAIAAKGIEGVSVQIERQGDKLIYQGFQVGELREEEKHVLGDTTLKIEGTLYDIDDKRKLVAVYSYFPIAVIGPPPNSRYQLYSIVNGQVQAVKEYPFLPQFVQKNTDGSVWIASERKPARHYYYAGSGLLAVMDQDGHIHVANRAWNEQDVSPIGLTSPTRNPVDPEGRMIVRLYGKPYDASMQGGIDASAGINPMLIKPIDAEKDGLYEADTSFQLRKLSNAPDDEDELMLYKDKSGDIYTLNRYSNRVTNWTRNQSRTWTDIELLTTS
jgi:hypothetical protein